AEECLEDVDSLSRQRTLTKGAYGRGDGPTLGEADVPLAMVIREATPFVLNRLQILPSGRREFHLQCRASQSPRGRQLQTDGHADAREADDMVSTDGPRRGTLPRRRARTSAEPDCIGDHPDSRQHDRATTGEQRGEREPTLTVVTHDL